MNLFELFIRRPVATIMLNVALLVFGVVGLSRLPVRELPDIDPSVVTVLTVYPGASAEVVETEVTERLEEAISSAESIKLMTSESREQASSITVEFTQGRNVDLAAQDVRDRVARVRGALPDDIEEPVISKQDSGARPIMWIAFSSPRHSIEELTQVADDLVKDRLQTVPGVSSVILGGEKRLAMRIWLDSERMAAHRVTVLDVESALRSQNVELPSGRVENRDREFTIRTMGQLADADEFNRLILRQDGTEVVRLGDVGHAVQGVEDERSIARFNSRPSIGLGVVRQSRANTLSVAKGVKARMDELASTLPPGIEYAYPYDESVYVGQAVTEVWKTLGLAFILVVLTIFVFLRSVRSTLVPALAIPISVVATFGVLHLMGFSINIFTLLALVLAIGIVVDDAIVVLENVYRHVEDGMTPMAASIQGIKEIAFAVVATTLSLVAVFLPLAFIGGITGRLLLEFAVALAGAVIVSSIVALTLSPMAAARLLKPIDQVEHGRVFNFFERRFDRMNRGYERGLRWALGHRWAIVMVGLASLVASIGIFQKLDREFLPEEDKGRLLGIVVTPEGSTPEYTDRMMQQAEEIVAGSPEVEAYFTAVAIPFDGPGNAATGFMFIRLTDGERRHVRDVVGGPAGLGARMFGEVEGGMSFPIMSKAVDIDFGQPFRLVIEHPDLERLNQVVQDIITRFRQEGFLANVRTTFEINKPEFRIQIDRDRAGALGVSIRDLSRTLQILFGGEDISEIKVDGKQYEVMAQLQRDRRLVPSDIDRLYVRNGEGRLIQVSNLVTVEEGAGPTSIQRFSRQRAATIEATPAGVTLGTAADRAETVLAEILPAGFNHDWLGEVRNLKESSGDIYGFMILAVIVVYMVLGAQFESFVHPFTVMLALPLAFLGAFGLLYGLNAFDQVSEMLYGWANYAPDAPGWVKAVSPWLPRIPSMNLNIFSQVGLILLIGLVTKNSILLVEFANQQMEKGAGARDAILAAGLIRLRPILMTSLATIAGILPIAIGVGEATDSRRPLGVVAVGGMITSTVLTLFVIPVMYTLFDDLARKLGLDSARHQKEVTHDEILADERISTPT